jgi:hypothetical protein
MDTQIDISTDSREAAQAVASAREAFRAETRELSAHLAGVTVRLDDAPPAGQAGKAVRVRVDFRGGGRFLCEARGGDWGGLVAEAAARAGQGARRYLAQRWDLAEAQPASGAASETGRFPRESASPAPARARPPD